MGRRYRPQKARGAAPDPLMAWYLKDRARTDAWIDTDVARSCTSKQQYSSEADAHAHALMNGRDHVLPDDVQALCVSVLGHRLQVTERSRYAGRGAAAVLTDILGVVPVPT